MAQIANPIYDAAFKYLMDDPRVAKTLIAAVLQIDKKDIIELTPDRNEISIYKKDEVNACRLDFTVRIKTNDGEKAIYIELQKAWSKGEMKRFRQYLASQYTRASNVGNDNFPLPVMSIYILGETVDHLDEAVTLIKRHYENQNGEEINKDKKSWFVECLSHDMVVIQIPKIQPRPNSTLDNLLTFFDQSKQDPRNHHVINYNINDYDIDNEELHDDMSFMVRRLEQATANEEMIIQMCLEDKIEEIVNGKKDAEEKLVEQAKMLKEQASQIQKRDAQIAKSIRKMYSRGVSVEELAEDFDVDVQFVKEVLEKK